MAKNFEMSTANKEFNKVEIASINESPSILKTVMTELEITYVSEKGNNVSEKENHSIKYRPSIDGLRTIAILLVVFFHGWPRVIPGGFIGVDVFFVISGYLISYIIFKEYWSHKFSYCTFYFRRMRRLFPALIVVLITVIIIECFFSHRNQVETMSKTLIAATIFGANIQIFLLKPGYFDPSSKLNPLLHLWSLGVEEQFYIVWPFLASFVILGSFFRGKLLIIIYATISFTANLIGLYTNLNFSYYFPLCRCWQMLFGSALAYYNTSNTTGLNPISKRKQVMNNILSIFGIFLIFLSSAVINQNTLYPGFWAILPTLGSLLILFSGEHAFFNHNVLSSKIFIFIGKISYPLYLWHWPLLVFSRIIYKENSSSYLKNPEVAILIAFILSILTYYLVEQKINKIKNRKLLVLLLSSLMILIFTFGIVLLVSGDYFLRIKYTHTNIDTSSITEFTNNTTTYGKPKNYTTPDDNPKNYTTPDDNPKNYTTIEEKLKKYQVKTTLDKVKNAYNDGDIPGIFERLSPINSNSEHYTYFGSKKSYLFNDQANSKKVVLWGDSYSEMVIFRIKHLHDKRIISPFPTLVYKVIPATRINTPCERDDEGLDNYRVYREIRDYIKRTKPMSVLIVAAYGKLYDELVPESVETVDDTCEMKGRKHLTAIFKKWAEDLKSITDLGIRVYIATIKPAGPEFSPYNMYDINGVIESNTRPVIYSEYMKDKQYFISLMEKTIVDSKAIKIDFSDNICFDDICPVLDPNGNPIYRDETHFRPFFAREFITVLDDAFIEK